MRLNAWLLQRIGYVGLTNVFTVKIYKPVCLKTGLEVSG